MTRTFIITREDVDVNADNVRARFNVTVDGQPLLITGLTAEVRLGWNALTAEQDRTWESTVCWPAIGSVDPETAKHFALCVQTAAAWAENEAERLNEMSRVEA